MRTIFRIIIACLLLSSCDSATDRQAADRQSDKVTEQGTAVALYYQEMEQGQEAYPGRIIVTADFLRLDSGSSRDDFVLFDRHKRVIYSTNQEEQTVLVIENQDSDVKPPIPLPMDVQDNHLANAPTVAGRTAQHKVIKAAGSGCYQLIAVPGLLPDVMQAMADYRQVLANEHKRILPMIPMENHDACDLLLNVFSPALIVNFGLPVEEWDDSGYRRTLLDYDLSFNAAAGLFQLPQQYRHYRPGAQ